MPSDPPGQSLPVPLFRAIEKLTSHHRHIIHLFSYARTAEGRTPPRLEADRLRDPSADQVPDIEFPKISAADGVIRPYFPAGTNLDHEVDAITAGVKGIYTLDLIDAAPRDVQSHRALRVLPDCQIEPRPGARRLADQLHRRLEAQLCGVLFVDPGVQRHAGGEIPDEGARMAGGIRGGPCRLRRICRARI